MGRKPREQKKDAVYELVNRTHQQIFALLPSDEVNKIILGLLAKYAWIYKVEIFAYCFMSNHFHILARCRSLQIHLFMRDFQSQLTKKINKLRDRTGTLWEGRYTSTAAQHGVWHRVQAPGSTWCLAPVFCAYWGASCC